MHLTSTFADTLTGAGVAPSVARAATIDPERPVALRPGSAVVMKPGGTHIVVHDVHGALGTGQKITVVLFFYAAHELPVTATIRG